MARVPELEFVTSPDGDWTGLYRDGKLVAEGHTLSATECLTALGIPFTSSDANEAWIQRVGRLPEDIKDVFYEL